MLAQGIAVALKPGLYGNPFGRMPRAYAIRPYKDLINDEESLIIRIVETKDLWH